MNQLEKRTAFSLAIVYAVRMLGLFMILPVLPLYATSIAEATPFLIGVAIGAYGLTQAIFQIPLGLLSDKLGRKRIIIGGLLIFAVGGIVAATADNNIYIIILGRALQGMGAIAAATMALAADLTREEHRAKVMAAIGMSIGFAFATAMIIGPMFNQWWGISGIFWVTVVLAFVGMGLVAFVVPKPVKTVSHRDAGIIGGYLKPALANPALIKMDAGVFMLHLIMTANFTVIPVILRDILGFPSSEHWKVYLPVFFTSFLLSVPLIIIAEKYQKIKPLLLLSIAILCVAELLLGAFHELLMPMLIAFLLFFVGFNFLEAVLPSLVAKYSSVNTKGTAMGVFSTSQFAGVFTGGVSGGFIVTHWGMASVFFFSACVALVWLAVAYFLPKPVFYKTRIIRLIKHYLDAPVQTANLLMQLPGVKEAAVATEEGTAYLKVAEQELDHAALAKYAIQNQEEVKA